ncbi:MAG: hypothetical protein EXR55_03005 [Dehalococcoidia bacterium]|nr:hypothetical protein [Dehalococcoidia bacterium]
MDGRRVIIIPDLTARNVTFRTGKTDNAIFQLPSEAKAYAKNHPNVLCQELRASTANQMAGTRFRLDKDPWNHVRVRRAMSLAIDYEAHSQIQYEVPYNGNTAINGGWYSQSNNSVEWMTKDCGCPWYQGPDIKRAKALLAEAGYPNGFTAVMEYGYGNQTPYRELLSAFWKEIGVTVQIKLLDYTVYRSNLDKGTWTDMSEASSSPMPPRCTEQCCSMSLSAGETVTQGGSTTRSSPPS